MRQCRQLSAETEAKKSQAHEKRVSTTLGRQVAEGRRRPAPRQRLRSFCAGPFCAVAPGSIGFELALCAGVLACARACSCVCAHAPEKPGHPPAPLHPPDRASGGCNGCYGYGVRPAPLPCTHACRHARMHARMRTHTCAHARAMRVCGCARPGAHAHTCAHTRACVRAGTHARAHTHTHARARSCTHAHAPRGERRKTQSTGDARCWSYFLKQIQDTSRFVRVILALGPC